MLRYLIVAVLPLTSGCKKNELPANVPYTVRVAFLEANGQDLPGHPARGGTVYRDGTLFGRVEGDDASDDAVHVTLPASDLPSKWGTLELVLPSPCGAKRLPLEKKYFIADGERERLASSISTYHAALLRTSTPGRPAQIAIDSHRVGRQGDAEADHDRRDAHRSGNAIRARLRSGLQARPSDHVR